MKAAAHDEYDFYWRRIASLDGPVQIVGMCQSACTMVMAHIPKDRLCLARAAISSSIRRG